MQRTKLNKMNTTTKVAASSLSKRYSNTENEKNVVGWGNIDLLEFSPDSQPTTSNFFLKKEMNRSINIIESKNKQLLKLRLEISKLEEESTCDAQNSKHTRRRLSDCSTSTESSSSSLQKLLQKQEQERYEQKIQEEMMKREARKMERKIRKQRLQELQKYGNNGLKLEDDSKPRAGRANAA